MLEYWKVWVIVASLAIIIIFILVTVILSYKLRQANQMIFQIAKLIPRERKSNKDLNGQYEDLDYNSLYEDDQPDNDQDASLSPNPYYGSNNDQESIQ